MLNIVIEHAYQTYETMSICVFHLKSPYLCCHAMIHMAQTNSPAPLYRIKGTTGLCRTRVWRELPCLQAIRLTLPMPTNVHQCLQMPPRRDFTGIYEIAYNHCYLMFVKTLSSVSILSTAGHRSGFARGGSCPIANPIKKGGAVKEVKDFGIVQKFHRLSCQNQALKRHTQVTMATTNGYGALGFLFREKDRVIANESNDISRYLYVFVDVMIRAEIKENSQ